MRTLAQDGWNKTVRGLTTPEEVMRVTSAEDNTTREDAAPVAQDGVAAPQAGDAGKDRRVFIRLDNTINIRYKVFRSDDELIRRGVHPEEFSVTKNISAGGLLFISTEMLAPGAIMELNMDLPNSDESIECLARVVRVEDVGSKYDIGVCFLDLTGAQRARLEKYVKSEFKME